MPDQKTQLLLTRNDKTDFSVVSGKNTYCVSLAGGRWACTCPARGMCKHLRTVIACLGMAIGDTISIGANNADDDGLLSPEEFDAEAGRDVLAELEYIRSGREKRNYGC